MLGSPVERFWPVLAVVLLVDVLIVVALVREARPRPASLRLAAAAAVDRPIAVGADAHTAPARLDHAPLLLTSGAPRAPALAEGDGRRLDPGALADRVWATRCSVCHGADGRADGPATRALEPRPTSFASPGARGSDADLASIIVDGGARFGLSPLMAPNKDLASRPDVVGALVRKIRGFSAPR